MRVGRPPTLPTAITSIPMRISIVVPTRDRPGALARCLAALGRRARGRGRRRRLPRPRGARPRARRRPGARLVRAPAAAGPATARNLGARAADRRGRLLHRRRLRARARAGREALARGRRRPRARRRAGPWRRPGAPAAVRASQAIVERADARLARPGDRPARLRPELQPGARPRARSSGCRSTSPSRRAAGEDRDWSAARERRPASRPCTCPRPSSSTARRSGRAAFVRQQYALRARGGALPGARATAGGLARAGVLRRARAARVRGGAGGRGPGRRGAGADRGRGGGREVAGLGRGRA